MEKSAAATITKIGKSARIGLGFQKNSDERRVDCDSIDAGVFISVVFQSSLGPLSN
jgi:hypothetical protein